MSNANPNNERTVPRFRYNLRDLFRLTTWMAFSLGIIIVMLRLPPGVLTNVFQYIVLPAGGALLCFRTIQSIRAIREGVREAIQKCETDLQRMLSKK